MPIYDHTLAVSRRPARGEPGTWSHFEGDEAIGLLGCRTVREDLRYAEAEVVEAYRHAEKVVRLEPDPMLDEPQVVHNYKQKLQAAEVLKKKCPDTYLDILGLRVDEDGAGTGRGVAAGDDRPGVGGAAGAGGASAGGDRRSGASGGGEAVAGAGGEGRGDVAAIRADARAGLPAGLYDVHEGAYGVGKDG